MPDRYRKPIPSESIWLPAVCSDRPLDSTGVASLARTHQAVPRYCSGIRLENVAPCHPRMGASATRLPASVDANSTSHGVHPCRSCGGGMRHASPATSGSEGRRTDALRHPADHVARLHRQPFAVRRDPLEQPLGAHAAGVKQPATPKGRAEPDRQRSDVRCTHGGGVPACRWNKTGFQPPRYRALIHG